MKFSLLIGLAVLIPLPVVAENSDHQRLRVDFKFLNKRAEEERKKIQRILLKNGPLLWGADPSLEKLEGLKKDLARFLPSSKKNLLVYWPDKKKSPYIGNTLVVWNKTNGRLHLVQSDGKVISYEQIWQMGTYSDGEKTKLLTIGKKRGQWRASIGATHVDFFQSSRFAPRDPFQPKRKWATFLGYKEKTRPLKQSKEDGKITQVGDRPVQNLPMLNLGKKPDPKSLTPVKPSDFIPGSENSNKRI